MLFKKLLLSLALVLLSFGASASGSYVGTVYAVVVTNTGIFQFQLGGAATGSPSCALTNYIDVDGTTTAGKAQAGALTMAMFAGKTVYIYGTGACSLASNVETLNYANVVN